MKSDTRMKKALDFVHPVVRNKDFDLGFKTGYTDRQRDIIELVESLREITEMALRWSVKGVTPTIFKAQKTIKKYSK